jgi:hypothetical protein
VSTMCPVYSVNHVPGLYQTSAQPGRAGASIPNIVRAPWARHTFTSTCISTKVEKHSTTSLQSCRSPFDFAQAGSRLRSGMTKGSAALPWRAVAKQNVFFITWVGASFEGGNTSFTAVKEQRHSRDGSPWTSVDHRS